MHHIARCFARVGWRVGFLSAPIGLPHLIGLGGDAQERVASWRSGGAYDLESGIWHFVPFAPLPWGVLPVFANHYYVQVAWKATQPSVTRALRRANLYRPDFACADHFLHEGLLRAANPRLRAFRRADNAAGFPGALADFGTREADFARRADLTIVTNQASADEFAAKNIPDIMLIENGLLLDRFRQEQPCPHHFRIDRRPAILFVGAADSRLDSGLLLRVVRQRPQYLWTFIGPFDGELARALLEAGALLPGTIPHDQVAAYLQHARVGIVPFSLTRSADLIRHVSSLKVFEYAACGLPIVGTRGCIYPNNLPVPLIVCDSEQQFIDAIDYLISARRPSRPALEAFESFDWPFRLRPLFDWLDQHLAD